MRDVVSVASGARYTTEHRPAAPPHEGDALPRVTLSAAKDLLGPATGRVLTAGASAVKLHAPRQPGEGSPEELLRYSKEPAAGARLG